MPLPEPFRGEIWDVDFPDFGLHPAVILSVNALNSRLGHVAVVPVTGTPGPPATHIPLTADAGLTRYDQSYADVTALQPVDRAALVRQRGRLVPSEVERLAVQLRTYLGL
ncbi:type II toxin-antitoxin system PemK/MazF family toxin [Modestobacter sp. Leaf380]|uniref:type II toxin-antitoxin system PemK/MazF family toxin n=1 Tax=Modestobacter sp. Leaf380 TaxID=1736356 RepID=UPI0006F41007|nr:type II toxin-antitoxin system PemK/MazF family toxin [Modestobacter sp. Leaf380]KQS66546.1 MazF family transcriptional regulator [Modestobacter sp. Leaf380]